MSIEAILVGSVIVLIVTWVAFKIGRMERTANYSALFQEYTHYQGECNRLRIINDSLKHDLRLSDEEFYKLKEKYKKVKKCMCK